jgi:predicted small lipoprotein YifL
MNTKQLSSVLLLCTAVVLAACGDQGPLDPGSSTSAATAVAPSTSAVVDKEVIQVSFVIPAGTCGLTTEVTGTGELRMVFRITQSGNGEYHVGINTTAKGTATGADGSRYLFNYLGNGRYFDYTGDAPFHLYFVDDFLVIGQGSAPDVRVFFNAVIQIEADNSYSIVSAKVNRGDPLNCDKI